MKKLLLPLIAVFALAFASVAPVIAAHGDGDGKEGKQCSLKKGYGEKGKDCAKGDCEKGKESSGHCPIAGKIMKKAEFFLSNADALGLTEVQINKIKSIQHETKKNSIRQAAEMQVFEMETMEKLSASPVDQEGLNAMIDQATAGFSASAKQSVQTYVDLKNVLDDDQMAKAKEIWKKQS